MYLLTKDLIWWAAMFGFIRLICLRSKGRSCRPCVCAVSMKPADQIIRDLCYSPTFRAIEAQRKPELRHLITRPPGDRHATWNCSITATRRLTWGSRVRYACGVPTLLLEGSNTPRHHRKHYRDRPAGVSWCSVFGC